jgi:hypothetical protein
MLSRIFDHFRGNAVGYVALFAALGGTSYAAVSLPAASVHAKQLANGAVTHAKLARGSVNQSNLVSHSLTAADFKAGVLRAVSAGGPTGPAGPAGQNGTGSIVMKGTSTGAAVTAPHGASTNVPLSGATWTQGANDLNLVTGSVDLRVPASCTGSFGNALAISVDGVANTFAVAPTAPASATITVPFAVSEIMQSGAGKAHTITASLGNSCTKSGEDYTVSNVKVDVLAFH